MLAATNGFYLEHALLLQLDFFFKSNWIDPESQSPRGQKMKRTDIPRVPVIGSTVSPDELQRAPNPR